MAQRALIGLDLLALQRAAMDGLCLAGAPAGPDQARSFFAGQPALARPALLRQRHVDHGMVQVLTGMMPDRRPQILKIAPRAAGLAARLDISSAKRGVDLSQHFAAEELVQPLDPSVELLG